MELLRIEKGIPYLDAVTMTVLMDAEKRKQDLLREMNAKGIDKIDTTYVTISRETDTVSVSLKMR